MSKNILRISVVLICLVLSLVLYEFAQYSSSRWVPVVFNQPHVTTGVWVTTLLKFLYAFFIITVCFPLMLFIGWMLLADKRGRYKTAAPFVSIIVPAYNEEKPILRSLEALERLDYPSYEVIVVNDGSTDFTFSAIESARVKCVHLKKNMGKAAALNAGISRAQGSIVVFSDSDSWLDSSSLRYLIQGFSSPEIGAVSGTVEVEHPNSLLRKWQYIEYTFGQFLVKEAQLGSGASVAICPGPICAFRKDLLTKIGGFSTRTITEDFDATLEIIGAGYKVNYAPKAIAFTKAPADWQQLKAQRLRWFRGHLQTFRLHKGLFFSRKSGALGMFWLPFYYLFLGYLCGALEFGLIPLVPALFIASGDVLSMLKVASFYIIFGMFFVGSGYGIVLVLANRFSWSLLAAAWIMYPYLFYLNYLRILSVLNEARGKTATWSG